MNLIFINFYAIRNLFINILPFLFICSNQFVFAQEETINSIEQTLHNRKISSKDKILYTFNTINDTKGNYYLEGESLKQMVSLVKKNITLARKESDPQFGILAYSSLLLVSQEAKDNTLAKDSVLWYISQSDNALSKAKGLNILGYKNQYNPDAVSYRLQAIDLLRGKTGKEESDYLFTIYGDIGNQYRQKEDYNNSIKYMDLAISVAEKSGNINLTCKGYSDLAAVYTSLYIKKYNTEKILDNDLRIKTLDIFQKAQDLYTRYPDKIDSQIYSSLLINKSDLYIFSKEYDLYQQGLEEALAISIKNNYKQNEIHSYIKLAFAWTVKKEYKKAEDYYKTALELTKNLNANTAYELPYLINLNLGDLYMRMSKYEQASHALVNGFQEYKKVNDRNLIRTSKELEARYQSEKKEEEIKYLKEREKVIKIQNYLYISLATIFFLGSILLYYSYSYKLKYSKQRELSLKQEKKLQEEETKLLISEKEKTELENKLKEQEISQLQKEILAGSLHIEHKNELLQELGNTLKENPDLNPAQIKKIISQEIRLDTNFEEFKTNLREIHPEFYKRLQEKADHKLTPLDLKYCTCIFMKISSKEISNLLNVEVNSVRVGKYRLKQKLNLGKDENLNAFIETLI